MTAHDTSIATAERPAAEVRGPSPACLVCRETAVEVVLDLGQTAPANNFVLPEELASTKEPMFPLRVGLCRACGHVQLTDFVPPSVMFDHYLYMSSASSTLTNHLHGLARTVTERLGLGAGALVVDVGCNDGTLLEGFRLAGVGRRIGVDPAANLAAGARAKGAEVVTAYFTPEVAASLRERNGPAAAITMTNTFPHIPDLPSLMRGVDRLLADDGALVLEAHYLVDLMEMCAFDTVYHEHVSYWALKPMVRLFREHGFDVFDVERLPIHHGQLRAWVCRAGKRPISAGVGAMLEDERARGLDRPEPYRRMAQHIGQVKADLIALIRGVRAAGGRVVGYGAPAKGSTLLAYFGLGASDLDYIADRNVLKQGRLTPGSHIPIVPAERIIADQPDMVLLLAWNFAEEIAQQLKPYLDAGGRIVVPVPDVREIGGAS
jgi:SAM-dependent methyltransferase